MEDIQITGDESAIAELKAFFEKNYAETELMVSQRKNLSGDTPIFLFYSGIVIHQLKPLLDFLKDWKKIDKVKSIQIGKLKVENPNQQIIDEFIKALPQLIANEASKKPKPKKK